MTYDEAMVRRRKILIGIGTVSGSAVLAGCSSGEPESNEGNTSEEENSSSESNSEQEEPEEENSSSGPANEEEVQEEEEPEPASFEVVSYDMPETLEIGEDFTFEITIRNTGGQEGDLIAPIYVRTPNIDWQEIGDLAFIDVEPGDTATEGNSEPYSLDYINRYEFTIGQSPTSFILQTVSAKVSWGEEYTTPAGYRIRVDEPTLQDTYEYENWEGNIVDKAPESGGQWAFINVWVKNETGQSAYSPLARGFGLLHGSSQSDGEIYLSDQPVNKDEPFEGGELQPNVERSGWILYQIPNDLSVDDLTIAWSDTTYNGDIAANWGSQ